MVLIPSKLLKDESLKEFKETIIKYQYLAPHFEKKNGKKKWFWLHSDHLRCSQDSRLVALDGFKSILAKFLHETTHHGTDKLATILNQHGWGNFKKTAEVIFKSHALVNSITLENL